MFCPLTMTGPEEAALQTCGETRLAADSKVNSATLVGHVKITLAPEAVMVSCGALITPKERLNTVPEPPVPPPAAVPYRVLPDRNNPANGDSPLA